MQPYPITELAQATYRKMVQNLWWATGYNERAIPLAAGILYPIGFLLPPAVGALIMLFSTVIVALNARLLQRFEPATAAADRKNSGVRTKLIKSKILCGN